MATTVQQRQKRTSTLDSPSYANLANEASESAHQINPFINHSKHDAYYYFKLVVCGATLVPLRVFFLVFCFGLIWVFSAISVIGLGPLSPSEFKPFPRWRLLVLQPTRWLLRLLLFTSGFYYIKEKGQPDPSVPFITPNHISLWEGMFIGTRFLCSPVSKIENARVPALGALMTALQPILVDRSAPYSRNQARDALVARGHLYKSGKFPPVLIFPEGIMSIYLIKSFYFFIYILIIIFYIFFIIVIFIFILHF